MTSFQTQPDIGYYPDFEKYQTRSRRPQQHESVDESLPPGYPTRLVSAASWDRSIADTPERWLFRVTPEQITELRAATYKFRCLNLPLSHISQATFDLPKFGPVLREYSRIVHYGIGFVILRGLDVDTFNREEQVIVFAGVASYIGNTRARQDQAGAAISHITDLTKVHDGAIGNPAFTAGPQAIHTDPGPIIGMFCLNPSAKGGESVLASSSTIYNAMVRTKPSLIRTLTEDWILDGFGGDPPYTTRPLMYLTVNPLSPTSKCSTSFSSDSRIIVQFVRRALTGFLDVPRTKSIPPITEAQAEALDALHFMGLENAIRIKFQRGDLQFVNNLNIMHAREGYEDSPNQKRHLLRMWLKDTEYGWEIPQSLEENKQWGRLWELDMKAQFFPLEPQVKSEKFSSLASTSGK